MFDELCFWTLAQTDSRFIHQHAADAYAAQHASASGPTIAAAFALVGLYLAVEKGWTGRQVQRTHMLLANQSKAWPRFVPPTHAGEVTVAEVLSGAAGRDRERSLLRWCASVWAAWGHDQARVRMLVETIR